MQTFRRLVVQRTTEFRPSSSRRRFLCLTTKPSVLSVAFLGVLCVKFRKPRQLGSIRSRNFARNRGRGIMCVMQHDNMKRRREAGGNERGLCRNTIDGKNRFARRTHSAHCARKAAMAAASSHERLLRSLASSHVRCLAEARSLGDLLVVAVNSDGSVRGNKGPERPLVPQNDRAEVLAALASVDYVTIFDEPTPRDLIARLLPAYSSRARTGTARCSRTRRSRSRGGRVVSIPLAPGYSTTNLLQKIRKTASSTDGGTADHHT